MLNHLVRIVERCNPYTRQLPFAVQSFQRIPGDAHGVYGIWFRRRCIYIGKADSQTISTRLRQHWEHSHNDGLQAWIKSKGRRLRVSYLAVSSRKNIDMFERYFIARFQPITNRVRYEEHEVVPCTPERSRK